MLRLMIGRLIEQRNCICTLDSFHLMIVHIHAEGSVASELYRRCTRSKGRDTVYIV